MHGFCVVNIDSEMQKMAAKVVSCRNSEAYDWLSCVFLL